MNVKPIGALKSGPISQVVVEYRGLTIKGPLYLHLTAHFTRGPEVSRYLRATYSFHGGSAMSNGDKLNTRKISLFFLIEVNLIR